MEGYSIRTEARHGNPLVVVTLRGTACLELLTPLFGELDRLVSELATPAILVDEEKLRPGLMGPAEIRALVDLWRKAVALHGIRIAVVASNLAVYGLNRMFKLIADSSG